MCVLALNGCYGAQPPDAKTVVNVAGAVVLVVIVAAVATSGPIYLGNCAAPDTPIATPSGDRPIASLREGDLVYSVHRQRIVVVPIAVVHRAPVGDDHKVVRVTFANGTVLRISPGHPTADGRLFADLRAGDRLDHERIVDVELVAYDQPFTHDILPASDTGAYFAGGALIGSTLKSGTE